jgi:hypothetical protein
MALLSKTETLFMWLSPVPFLLTIVIPSALVLISDFSPDVRATTIRMTRFGLELSAGLFLAGLFLLVRGWRAKRGSDRLMLLIATFVTGFRAGILLLFFSVNWLLFSTQ